MNKFLLFFIFILLPSISISKADTTPITYLVYTDNTLGFYKVIDMTTYRPSSYVNQTLIINQGDTVTWMDDSDVTITVISDQKLFSDKILGVRQRSSYTFNQIGTYTFYIKEFIIKEAAKSRQTINVNPTDIPIPTPAATITANIPTPSYTSIPPTPISTPTMPTLNPAIIISFPFILTLSLTQFISIVVAMISLFITYKVGKNG